MIKLQNTLTGNLDVFTPQNSPEVTLYTCGPTVYSEPLIGNWVAYIRWDLLVRTLMLHDYTVKRVMNITDVGHLVSDADDGEDKVQKRAAREGVTAWQVAEKYTQSFFDGMKMLTLLSPDIVSKATENIPEQIKLIQQLESKGHTYQIEDGVYFDTTTFPDYAHFARLNLESLKAGARIGYHSKKKNPSDFALWKFSPSSEKRDMEWDSPWGKGFPGWHIECSAMALKYLGMTIDIHTGGIDHIPVHHTNEIAQSEAVTGKRFANYWLHANFLLVDGKKISKSLGNGYTLQDLKTHGFNGDDFKLFVLQSQYHTETNFSWDNLAAAANRLQHWKSVACLRHQLDESLMTDETIKSDLSGKTLASTHAVKQALANDLNSPLALSYIEQVIDAAEKAGPANIDGESIQSFFSFVDKALGFSILDSTPDVSQEVEVLLNERVKARKQQDWQRSDELRESLAAYDIGVNDTSNGTRWYYL